jgi:hypothetical protein
MIPIQVTAQFEIDGEIRPISFHWQGMEYPVLSTGRRWFDDKGQHVLVMIPGDQIIELVFVPVELVWYMNKISALKA